MIFTEEIPVPVVPDAEQFILELQRPLWLIIQGIMATGKSYGLAHMCVGMPTSSDQRFVRLIDQNPNIPPLYVKVILEGRESRIWYVQEETPELKGYYEARERFRTGVDKVPDSIIGDFQFLMQDHRESQALKDIPRLLNQGLCAGTDGCPGGDWVYGSALFEQGLIIPKRKDEFMERAEQVFKLWHNVANEKGVDLVVAYLLAENEENWPLEEATPTTAETAWERIKVRGIDAEQGIKLETLLQYNNYQNQMFGVANQCGAKHKFTVNTGTDAEQIPTNELVVVRDIVYGVAEVLQVPVYTHKIDLNALI